MLKNVVNSNKNFLDSVDVAVKNIPTLGPVLGPSEPPTAMRLSCSSC